MQRGVLWKLSVMMFLEFFIWGAWLPPSFGLFGDGGLGFTQDVLRFNLPWGDSKVPVVLQQQDLLNFAFPISAIIAMFFANQFVDRHFSAERFLAFSHLVGGVAMLLFAAGWHGKCSNQGIPRHRTSGHILRVWPCIACFMFPRSR
ncbi:MAG: hypothetical protein KatS3mg113_0139 [Planctomycetaceae bacterium]|nr:MAG: hypothetical protein KatS3mg113_0139 [Planctomycetaceae bacterium]